jgi:hypothetical protein
VDRAMTESGTPVGELLEFLPQDVVYRPRAVLQVTDVEFRLQAVRSLTLLDAGLERLQPMVILDTRRPRDTGIPDRSPVTPVELWTILRSVAENALVCVLFPDPDPEFTTAVRTDTVFSVCVLQEQNTVVLTTRHWVRGLAREVLTRMSSMGQLTVQG